MAKQAEEIKLPDGKITDNDKAVVVLVIGESARKANFQLYGYKRANNPRLSKQQGLKVFQAQSCATFTTAGVSQRTAATCTNRCLTMPSEQVPTWFGAL